MKKIILLVMVVQLIAIIVYMGSIPVMAEPLDPDNLPYYNKLEGDDLVESVHKGYLHFRYEGLIRMLFTGTCTVDEVKEWLGDALPEFCSFNYEDYTPIPSFPGLVQREGEMIRSYGPDNRYTEVYVSVSEDIIEETVLAIARKRPDRLYNVDFVGLDAAACLSGDLDWNGVVDAIDYISLKKSILERSKLSVVAKYACDVDKNGEVDAKDYFLLKRAVLCG